MLEYYLNVLLTRSRGSTNILNIDPARKRKGIIFVNLGFDMIRQKLEAVQNSSKP